MHASGSGRQACKIYPSELCSFEFRGLSGGKGKQLSGSFYSQQRRFWCACQRTEMAVVLDISLFCASVV